MNAPIDPDRVSSRVVLSRLLVVTVLVWTLPVAFARAAGGDPEEARAYFDKATASFALGDYAVAADSFEKAFQAKSDPALLYNAAQAHRLAGHKERALTLYQNYLRVYAKAAKRPEVEARIDELKKAIAHDREMGTPPPPTTTGTPSSKTAPDGNETAAADNPAPVPPPIPVASAVASSGSAATAPVDLQARPPAPSPADTGIATRARPEESRPLTSKPLFWAAVGGAIVAAIAVIVVVAVSGAKDPSPSLGVVP